MVAENRIYQAYYTKSEPIVHYMVELLELKGAETILEPCAGDGIFIDFIIDKFKQVKLDAFELNCDAFKLLSEKYDAYENVIVKQTDTLTDIDLELGCSMGGNYDAIIANPPYGAWRAVEHRKKIKKMYNGLYAKESYALFLYRCIEALKDKGKLVFIIPDTYLNLHRHKGIRRHILTRTKIKEIALFPSSYFPGVNFGYANLSIISLEKCSNNKEYLNNEFEIIKGFRDVSELNSEKQNHLTRITISQQDVFQHSNYAFITTSNTKVASLLQSTKTTIGDLCNCVTGFYSGNDKCFLKVRNKGVRNAKRYDTVDLNQVAFDCEPNMIQGLEGEKAFVPIVKGGKF